jgi:hypothetical protein
MRSTDDITPLDELLARACRVPIGDETERVQLALARGQLERVLDDATRRRAARSTRWRRSLASIPVIASCLTVVLIAVVAFTVLRPRPATPHGSSAGPAATPAADALIAKLAVLRRPQTSADRLPRNLEINRGPAGTIPAGRRLGMIVPSLSRLVATLPGARLYLVVTTPVGGDLPIWSASLGDQVTIVAITGHGVTETPGYPAVELPDASEFIRAGITPAPGGAGARTPWPDAYDVAIVPDGVARVRWTFANQAGAPGRTITAAVRNNVAITHLTASTAVLLRATWYAADGRVVPSSDAALVAAEATRTASQREQALRQAEHQHVTLPAGLLDAFAVFTFNSPNGTRIRSGYVVSHPPLSEIPLSILRMSTSGQLDLRQARHVISPSGLDMWAIPGTNGLCVFATDRTRGPYGRISNGAGGGCSPSVRNAESEGSGFSSTGATGSIIYGIIPKTMHTVTIPTGVYTHTTIHPVDGVYITPTPARFG